MILKVICGILLIGGIIALAVLGFAFNLASDFAVFSFVMGSLYIILFVIASAMYYDRETNKYETPLVYSAYGQPIYKFESRT